MGVLLFFLISYLLLCVALQQVFAKAKLDQPELSLKSSDAWVPGVNFARWCTLVGRKTIYALWLLVPIVSVFIYASLCVDLARSFGKHRFVDAFLSVVAAPFYFYWLSQQKEVHYDGPILEAEQAYQHELSEAARRGEKSKWKRLQENNPFQRSPGREWAEAVIFAVAAAALIRLFIFEMYTIPTSSMEGSMLVGDYLVVSKAHYGIRTPKTVAMVPLLHNRLPFDLGESYLEWPSLDMYRLPAIESIDRNDPIVFNFPLGDSVYVMPGRTWSAEDIRFGNASAEHTNAIRRGQKPLITRPLDKKDHYVKRAVAVAGDTVEIRNRDLYLNGVRSVDPPSIQFRYIVTNGSGAPLSFELLNEWGVSTEDLRVRTASEANRRLSQPQFDAVLNQEQRDNMTQAYPGVTFEPIVDAPGTAPAMQLFPHDPANFGTWTKDNFGPVFVPAAGSTVRIGPKNISLYRRAIEVYEGHEVEIKKGRVYIDGQPETEYTFAQDYYWAMGDNRHSSEDSRFWGFVPADHIVGKPLFIWFSTKNADIKQGIRWNRIFQGATQME